MTSLDAEHVLAAQGGDAGGFEVLVRRHARKVWALCWSRLHGRGPVEDLVQEAFARALQRIGTLDDPARFGPWVAGIARHACADWLKAHARTEVETPGDELDRHPHPADDVQDSEQRRRMHAAVNHLPEIYRDTLVQFYFGERSYREIAELYDITEATVNARLTRARTLLRQRLKGVET